MAVKVLATADIHIGLRPTKLSGPDESQRYSCARMWGSIVDRAIKENVDLVALAGDVVDHDNRFYEATGPLERGLEHLAEHGITTVAVAGNHDYDVLARLAEHFEGEWFRLLGRGGFWEPFDLEREGNTVLRVVGWSFPSVYVQTSPMADFPREANNDVPMLGLLHADLDVAGSQYAPVTLGELRHSAATLWLLGHIHAPQYFPPESGAGVLYPGSPQAMDPGETGVHGPWLIEFDGPRSYAARPLAMSKVRYESLVIDLAGVDEPAQLETTIVEQSRNFVSRVAQEDPEVVQLVLRLEFTGRTPLCGDVERLTASVVQGYQPTSGQLTARIEKTSNRTQPEIDLAELAGKTDPPGVLAGVLLGLQSGVPGDANGDLLREAHDAIRECYSAQAYRLLNDRPPEIEAARDTLIRSGTLLLETLRAQESTS